MKIVEPSVQVIDNINELDILTKIELSGRTAYKSENKITKGSAEKFVRSIIKSGHESVLEHANITVRFVCDRGCCYSSDTKVLTRAGFKLFSEIGEYDEIATINDDGELEYVFPKKVIRQKYKGNMIGFRNTHLDLLVTPNHNMWVFDNEKRSASTKVWKFLKASDMSNSRYRFTKKAKYSGNYVNTIKIPDVVITHGFYDKIYEGEEFESYDFMRLLGVWVADGNISFGKNGSGNRIVISQSKSDGRDYIEGLLNKLNIKYSMFGNDYRLKSPTLFNFLVTNFIVDRNARKTYYITVPQWVKELSPGLQECFLDGVIVGDGSKHTGGCGYQIYTASIQFAEDLVEIALKVGKAGIIRMVDNLINMLLV